MSDRKRIIGLVGNPNCGKTTLFNALTGTFQRVGNWPGVTVERKSGYFRHRDQTVEVVDLPGTYSLDVLGDVSLDEQVARDYVLSNGADLIINIVDASNLERNLYLTTQLLEMRVPMIIALNMTDVAAEKGISVDIDKLERETGCKVLPLVASKKQGVDALKDFLTATPQFEACERHPDYPSVLTAAIAELQPVTQANYQGKADTRWLALKALEGDALAVRLLGPNSGQLEMLRSRLEAELEDDIDVVTADARYAFIGGIVQQAMRRQDRLSQTMSDRIDRVVLNRVLGIPVFLLMMYLMFMFTINLGGAFIDFFDGLFGTVLVDGLAHLLESIGTPEWLTVVIANGIGGGIQTVATFVPVIGFLFIFLSILEDSGYMARAAFVMDRFMRFIGLPGKSFVPLIVGFGCNVPAIMATRTLESERDRLMTMTMAPFMSCGARLPIYALFAVAFFPSGGQNLVFALYLIGIAAAVLTGLALKHTLLPGQGTPFIMELPPYHLPTLKGVCVHSWSRLKDFIFRASKVIVPMVMVLNILNSVGTDGSFGNEDSEASVLSSIGKAITPAFTPLGMTEENWPAAVGVFTGVLAKEAVVGTLNALYEQIGADEEAGEEEEEPFSFVAGIVDAFATVPANLADLADKVFDPLGIDVGETGDAAAAAEEQEVSVGTYGAMQQLFPSTAAAFAYLLLVLLYFPCVAVLGAVAKEAGTRWAMFMGFWSTAFGYCVAVTFYQLATFTQHPGYSSAWLAGIAVFAIVVLALMRRQAARRTKPNLADSLTQGA